MPNKKADDALGMVRFFNPARRRPQAV